MVSASTSADSASPPDSSIHVSPRSSPARFIPWAVAALLLLGFLLRAPNLGDYALNPDEAIAVTTASNETLAEVWRNTIPNTHPFANHFVLHFMLKVSRNTAWLRSFSLITGTLLIVATYFFTRELFGRLAGLSAAFLVTLSPNMIELSRVCRNYNPGMLLLILSLFFLVRFLREDRWRDFYLYTFLELLAAPWHYSFVVALLGVKLALFALFLIRRPGSAVWLRAALLQIPLALLMGFLYVAHVSQWHPGIYVWSGHVLRDQLSFDPGAFLSPMIQLSRYLLAGDIGKLFFYIALLAGLLLLVNRRWLELTLCVMPILTAYAFLIAGRVPIGGSRYSFHLFPFLFALVVAWVPDASDRFRSTRANFRNLIRGSGKSKPGSRSPRTDRDDQPPSAETPSSRFNWALAPLLLMGIGYSVVSFGMIARGDPYTSLPELPTARADLEDFYTLVRERVGEDEPVLLSYQAFLVLRSELDPSPHPFAPKEADVLTLYGIEFIYTPAAGWLLTPEAFLRAILEVEAAGKLDPNRKVWAAGVTHSEWEPALGRAFHEAYAFIRFDVHRIGDSAVWLFGIDAAAAARLASMLPREPSDEYYTDFLGSQSRPI